MGNFNDSLATLILRQINFGWFQRVKICDFNNFGGFQKIQKLHNSELLKSSKWQFLSAWANPSASTFYQIVLPPFCHFVYCCLLARLSSDICQYWCTLHTPPTPCTFSMYSILIQSPFKWRTTWTLISQALFPSKNSNPYERFHIQHVWIFFVLQHDQNLFHIKSEWQKNHDISTFYIPN